MASKRFVKKNWKRERDFLTAVTRRFYSNENSGQMTKHFLKLRSRSMFIPLRSSKIQCSK